MFVVYDVCIVMCEILCVYYDVHSAVLCCVVCGVKCNVCDVLYVMGYVWWSMCCV